MSRTGVPKMSSNLEFPHILQFSPNLSSQVKINYCSKIMCGEDLIPHSTPGGNTGQWNQAKRIYSCN